MTEIEIGAGKRGRRAWAFDDVAVVPSRRTRDPQDVSTSWDIDAYKFELPVLSAPMDSAVSPATAIEIGKLGGLGVLDLEGLWTRYEDPSKQLSEIAKLSADEAVARMKIRRRTRMMQGPECRPHAAPREYCSIGRAQRASFGHAFEGCTRQRHEQTPYRRIACHRSHDGIRPPPCMIDASCALGREIIGGPIARRRKIELEIARAVGIGDERFATRVTPQFVTAHRRDVRRRIVQPRIGAAKNFVFEHQRFARPTARDRQRATRRRRPSRMRDECVTKRRVHAGRRPASTGSCHTPYAAGSAMVSSIASNIARTSVGARPEAAASPST